MARFMCVTLLSAVLGLVLAGGDARAEFIHWSYNSDPEPSIIYPAGLNSGPIGLYLSNPSTTMVPEIGNQTVRVVDIMGFVNGQWTNTRFTTKVLLTDDSSHASGTLLFTTLLNGKTDTFVPSSTVTATFSDPSIQSIVLGNNRYTVTFGPFNPLVFKPFPHSPPGTGDFLGSIDAQVNVSPATGVNGTPEPSCLVLAGIGLVTVAGASWRRCRKAALLGEAPPAG